MGAHGQRGDRLAASVTGSGPRVVLVHGFTQSSASWRRIAAHLDGFELVAVDLPGHGASGGLRPADLDEAAALLGATGGRGAYVGYSLGGRIALTLALAKPELVGHLVLVGATAGIEDDDERRERRAHDGALADRLDPPGGGAGLSIDAFLATWLAGPLFAHLGAEQADLPARLVNSTTGLASSLRSVGAGTQRPSWGELRALEMPVSVLAGEKDEKFRALGTRLVASIGANASLEIAAGAGHAVPFEQPERFAAWLRAELTTRSRR